MGKFNGEKFLLAALLSLGAMAPLPSHASGLFPETWGM
jgi:hypothetical protein